MNSIINPIDINCIPIKNNRRTILLEMTFSSIPFIHKKISFKSRNRAEISTKKPGLINSFVVFLYAYKANIDAKTLIGYLMPINDFPLVLFVM